jgi:ABC-type uncharacterized transport system YnjBCD permease subunit
MADQPEMQLTKTDWDKIRKDLIWFFAVPAIAYITSFLALIQSPGHVFKWMDFVPNNTTIILFFGYLGNQALSALRKYIA